MDEAHDIMAECYGALGRLEAERDTLRQQLANSDAALRESRANDTAAMGHLADMRQQRDKLAKVLEDVEREHDLIRRMKNCEILRGRGSFGIAVMSDAHAIEWQALDKELQQFVDARRAALAETKTMMPSCVCVLRGEWVKESHESK